MPYKDLEDFIKKIRPRDLIEVDTIFQESAKYLVIKVNKSSECVSVLPLGGFFNGSKEGTVPILELPFYMIKKFTKLDNSSLLFLANYSNPHIVEALSNMVER